MNIYNLKSLSKDELMTMFNISYRKDLPNCLCGGKIVQEDVLHGGVLFCIKCGKEIK